MARRRRFRNRGIQDPFFLGLVILLIVGGTFSAFLTTAASFWSKYQDAVFMTAIFALIGGSAVGLFFRPIVRIVKYFINLKRFQYVQNLQESQHLEPYEFENYVGTLFGKLGYHFEVTRQSGDHGIDIMLKKGGKHYAVQVKQYTSSNVGEQEIREFYGSFRDIAEAGFFVTTTDFTSSAYAWAKQKPITLVNRHGLGKMIENFKEKESIFKMFFNSVLR